MQQTPTNSPDSFRLKGAVKTRLYREAKSTGLDRTQIVTAALESYFEANPKSRQLFEAVMERMRSKVRPTTEQGGVA